MQRGPITAQNAITTILDNICPNSVRHPWLTGFSERNNIAIRGLIEADTFGNLSDFSTDYPHAGLLDQLTILKAFIENETLIPFNVPTITETLKDFFNTTAQKERNLEDMLFNAQRHGEAPWNIHLPDNTRDFLKLLDQVQVLNYIAEKASTPPTEQAAAFQAILNWAQEKRTTLCNQQGPTPTAQNEYAYLVTGANRFSKLIRNEINALIRSYNRVKSTITTLATLNTFPIGRLILDGATITFRLGSIALFPWRLLLTTCHEGRYFIGRGINRIGRYLAPNNTLVQSGFHLLSLIASIYLIFQYAPYFSLGLLLGFKFFPDTWSFSFTFSLSLALSASELVAGLALGVGQRIVALVRRGYTPATDDPLTLNLDHRQRRELLTLLNTQLQGENLSAEERAAIGEELINLNNPQRPYLSSALDQRLLHQYAQTHDNRLPDALEPIRDRILPRPNLT